MGSFKEVQEILPLCLEDEIIDDEEFILLYEAYMPQNPSFPHSSQCRSKGNISGGGTRAPEARAARGVWGHAPPENFEI